MTEYPPLRSPQGASLRDSSLTAAALRVGAHHRLEGALSAGAARDHDSSSPAGSGSTLDRHPSPIATAFSSLMAPQVKPTLSQPDSLAGALDSVVAIRRRRANSIRVRSTACFNSRPDIRMQPDSVKKDRKSLASQGGSIYEGAPFRLGRHTGGPAYRWIVRSFEANSRRYSTKRIGKYDRNGVSAVD